MSGKRMVILGVFFGVVLAAGLLLPPIQSYKIRRHRTQIHTEQNSVPSVSVMISTNAIAGNSDWSFTSVPLNPNDARLGRQIIGTWTRVDLSSWTNEPLFRRTISADGSFSTSIGHTNALVTYQGTWLVKNQALVMTVTNAQGTGNHNPGSPAGSVDVDKIIHVDDHQFVYEAGGHTNPLNR